MSKEELFRVTLRVLDQEKEPLESSTLHALAAPDLPTTTYDGLLKEMLKNNLIIKFTTPTAFKTSESFWGGALKKKQPIGKSLMTFYLMVKITYWILQISKNIQLKANQ